MGQEEIRKLLLAITSLGVLMLGLIVMAIALVLTVQFQPKWLESWFSQPEKKEVLLAEETEEEWTSERLEEVGLVEGEGLQLVLANCTNCHSAKLVTQNRFTREGWLQVIRWMQETQGFWDLGQNEEAILDYLSTHFAPEPRGRRMPLEVEWYSLE